MARIAFYSHDTLGLGHLRRCLKLAHEFALRLAPVDGLIVSGSPWHGRFLLPPGFRLTAIEPVVKTSNGQYQSRQANRSLESVSASRRRETTDAIREFEPDLLIVDNVPTGFAGEVLDSLLAQRERGARSVLVLRDVLDQVDRIRQQWQRCAAGEAVRELFDEVWVFGDDADVIDLVEAGPLAPVAARVRSCGRLAPLSHVKPGAAKGEAPRILVAGGGGRDAPPLVNTYFAALARFEPKVTSQIILGPDFPTTPPTFRGDLAAERFVPDFECRVANSDVVVSMAGYNTVCEILAAGRPAVLVPRTKPRLEQWIRAKRLESQGRIKLVNPQELSPGRLWRAVDALLESKAFSPSNFLGGQVAAAHARRLLQTSAGAVR